MIRSESPVVWCTWKWNQNLPSLYKSIQSKTTLIWTLAFSRNRSGQTTFRICESICKQTRVTFPTQLNHDMKQKSHNPFLYTEFPDKRGTVYTVSNCFVFHKKCRVGGFPDKWGPDTIVGCIVYIMHIDKYCQILTYCTVSVCVPIWYQVNVPRELCFLR